MDFLWNIYPRKALKAKYIAHRIGRLMDSSRTESVFKTYVPYRYRVLLSTDDLTRVESFKSSMQKELIDFVNLHAKNHGYHLLLEPEIILEADSSLSQGDFKVEPYYENCNDTIDQVNTMVFDKADLIEAQQQFSNPGVSKVMDSPILEVLEGNEKGMKFKLTGTTITLGRREDNQVTINDPNVSRYHAQIVYDKDWWIEDLRSTNGLYVNGKKTKKGLLKTGDEIKIGSTLIKFRIR